MLKTGFFHRFIHYLDDPEKDYAWAVRESIKYGGMHTAKWQREMEGNWDIYGGARIWPMLSEKYHYLPLALDDDWAVYRVIDHGIRHPTCCLWVAVNRNKDRHVFREYYASNRPISLNCTQIKRLSKEPIIASFIDPSTKKRVNAVTTGTSKGLIGVYQLYFQNGVPVQFADNAAAGYDAVTDALLAQLARWALAQGELPSYFGDIDLKAEELKVLASKPALTFDIRHCPRVFSEMVNLRWKQLTGDPGERSEPQKSVDVADDGPDCVRYGMQSNLYWRKPIRRFQPGTYRWELEKRYWKRKADSA